MLSFVIIFELLFINFRLGACDYGDRSHKYANISAVETVTPPPYKQNSINPISKQGCAKFLADIYFLLDASGSVGSANFQKQKDFVARFAQQFDIGPNNVQIGVTTFSTAVHHQFYMNAHPDKASLLKAIENIPYQSGSTYTDKAIKYVADNAFTKPHGDRDHVVNILITMTDGQSNIHAATVNESANLHTLPIESFAIGIGSGIRRDELDSLASDSHKVFTVKKFNDLDSILVELKKRACEGLTSASEKSSVPNPNATRVQVQTATSGPTSITTITEAYHQGHKSTLGPRLTPHLNTTVAQVQKIPVEQSTTVNVPAILAQGLMPSHLNTTNATPHLNQTVAQVQKIPVEHSTTVNFRASSAQGLMPSHLNTTNATPHLNTTVTQVQKIPVEQSTTVNFRAILYQGLISSPKQNFTAKSGATPVQKQPLVSRPSMNPTQRSTELYIHVASVGTGIICDEVKILNKKLLIQDLITHVGICGFIVVVLVIAMICWCRKRKHGGIDAEKDGRKRAWEDF